MTIVRKITLPAITTGILSGGLLAGTVTPASAANECGNGYHQQEDGTVSASETRSQDGKSMTASVNGKVRWCTRDRNGTRDQFFQRVKVGVPSRVLHRGTFSGTNRVKICETASFTATISGGRSVDITIGTDGVSATASSPSDTSKTVTLPARCKTGTAAQSTTAFEDSMYNFSATAKNVSATNVTCPHISRVTVSTITSMTYRYGSTERTFTVRASNTDVPNNMPAIGC